MKTNIDPLSGSFVYYSDDGDVMIINAFFSVGILDRNSHHRELVCVFNDITNRLYILG